jgi:predicted anti-sigma-YlaC factor YlaD
VKLMITCEEASTLLSEKMDVPLSPAKRLLLQTHLLMCRKCTSVKKQMNSLRQVFLGLEDASSKDEINMPDSARDRIKQKLREQ